MNWKRLGIGLVLVDFSALTAYAIYQHGYLGFIDAALMNAWTIQLSVDLVLALSFVMVWMWGDARDRGISPLPYALVTLVLGSIGPLLYLFRREARESAPTVLAATARARG
jgi:hypothetical protein